MGLRTRSRCSGDSGTSGYPLAAQYAIDTRSWEPGLPQAPQRERNTPAASLLRVYEVLITGATAGGGGALIHRVGLTQLMADGRWV